MGYEHSSYTPYGARVQPTDAMPWWDFTEARPQGGRVASVRAGEYDAWDCFLVIPDTWKDLEAGDPQVIGPYSAATEPYLSWDALIVAAAEELKVPILGQLGWIFAPNVS